MESSGRWVRRLVAILAGVVVAGVLLAMQGPLIQAQERTEREEQEASRTEAQSEGSGQQQETLSGVFSLLWVDPLPGSDVEPRVEYKLVDDQGRSTDLLLDESDTESVGSPLLLDRDRVEVTGTGTPGEELDVQEITPEQGASAASEANAKVSGSKPTLSILCRFSDRTGYTPRDSQWHANLLGPNKPGLDHYWREVSYGNINLAGSFATAWVNLPSPVSAYTDANGGMLHVKLAEDCAAAADQAYDGFSGFTNINLIFNGDPAQYALGTTAHPLTFDGQTRNYGVTWIPNFALEPSQSNRTGQTWLAHEMGHTFGLHHSGGPYGSSYDSWWDVMSDGGSCTVPDAVYGCKGNHTNAYHKDYLGWIPSGYKHVVPPGADHTLTIQRLGEPNSNDSLMAQIPIGGSSTQFYTVEARRFAGYDDQIPGEAIVIHRVDTTRGGGGTSGGPAQIVDSNADNNRNVNDGSAMWLPGETFTDAANGISVQVTGATASGYAVRIRADSTQPHDRDGDGVPDFRDTCPTRPWGAGNGCPPDRVAPTGSVKINGGARTTTSLRVRLALTARDNPGGSGVGWVRASNDGRRWSGWTRFSPGISPNRYMWTLAKGRPGTRTAFVQYRDKAGNKSRAFRDTIRYAPRR